eukprot:jgi/Ulvmu1/4729/UM020_0013.1
MGTPWTLRPDAPEVYEMWEPETPQDYVRVVWAILIVFHVLVNLFCIWVVYRGGKWTKVPGGDAWLPGDVISVVLPHADSAQRNEDDAVAPADVLLISGTCMTDEAVLTGESSRSGRRRSRRVTAPRPAAGALWTFRQDKRSVLFGGTKVLNVSPARRRRGGLVAEDGGAIGVVLRTRL